MRLMTFTQFLNESKKQEQKHSYGCVMAFTEYPAEIKEIHKAIDDDDVYTKEDDSSFGLEKESHATILYGLHDEVTLKQVKGLLKDIDFTDLKMHNLSIFDNDEFDVLKFDVKSKSLTKANKALTDELPYTNKYKDYHAHMTVAYLKKGTAKKYVKKFKDTEFVLPVNKIVFSFANGDTKSFKVG